MRISIIVALALLMLYELLLEFGPKRDHPIMESQWMENQYVAETYVTDAASAAGRHGILVVGSSLSKRLDFNDERIYNLSFGGDSALTGLQLISSTPQKPDLVFVEINVPQRGVNRELVDGATEFLKKHLALFRIENSPSNLALSLFYDLTRKVKNYLTRNVKNDPMGNQRQDTVRDSVLQKGVKLQRVTNQDRFPEQKLNQNMEEFKQLVAKIEAGGSKVVFFELPINPTLEYLPRTIQIRDAFAHLFPHHRIISFGELSQGIQIQTEDGLHLSSSEARAVTENIKKWFN